MLAAAGAVASACAQQTPESTFLHADDLAKGTVPFDKNQIVEPGAFQDTITIDAAAIQSFLARGPYKRASFLETYQSNGIRAADAISNAAITYKINPLVILVEAEVAQGLVGSQFYPFPPQRVEYVFNCGCPSAGRCDPALAGFERQVACLAGQLRTSLDEIAANGTTAGNWGPGTTSLTLDNVKVTPADPSTAALYQYSPLVGNGSRGNWLFWNIWQNYAAFLEYSGPIGSGPDGAWIGEACQADSACVTPGAFCAKDYPGGMCTVSCSKDCPSDPDHPESFCADFLDKGGYCLAVCSKGVPGSCRAGYDCRATVQFGAKTVTKDVCVKL